MSACLCGIDTNLLLVLQRCVLWTDPLLASKWGLLTLRTPRAGKEPAPHQKSSAFLH